MIMNFKTTSGKVEILSQLLFITWKYILNPAPKVRVQKKENFVILDVLMNVAIV